MMIRNPAVLILSGAALAAVAALYFVLRLEAPTAPAATVSPAAPSQPHTIEVVVKNGRRVAGPERVQLRQNETVVLKVLSDRADDLHLHGYDLHLHLHANQLAELTFKAIHTGRFEYELHKSHLALGTLEVLPQ